MTTRESLQVVEIDIDRCGLTYGSSPCAAVLGTDGVRKCYNTFKTCQDTRHFNAPLEPSGGPDRTYSQGDTLTAADFTLNADFFFAIDLTIPLSPTGCVMEVGGTTTAAYLGFTSGNLVFRCGGGATGHPANTAKVDVDPSDILGQSGTLYGSALPGSEEVYLWWRAEGENEIVLMGSDTAASPFANWGGTQDGGLGTVVTSTAVGEDATDYNGTIYQMRAFDSTTFVPATPDRYETLRFARNQMGFKRSDRIYPALQSVSTNPSQVNLGGVSERTSGLGKRARVKISFKDFPDSDIWFDRYQSERVDGTAQTDEGGYNPLNRGTFFGKLRQRFPYYVGRALRVREGYVGDALASMRTRNYVITDWTGPDAAGNVTVTASDVLDLADDKKSKAPVASEGRLDADIDDSSLASFDLLPAGVGADYSTSGSAVIGSEVVTFTRSGDTITLTARAQNGSSAASHSEDDTFQECYVASNESIADVAYDLLVNYAGIDASFITLSDWTDEADKWLAGFDMNTVITKPTGVNTLLSELSQFGVMWWWDDQNQKIRMRANRPLDVGEAAPSITDRIDIIEGTPSASDMPDLRLSRVLFYHGQIDATDSATDGNNFARVFVAIDGDAEGPREYDQASTYEVFTRWLGQSGNSSVAGPVASRLLNRYRDIPQQITFEYDVKNEADVALASPVTVTSYVMQDDTGASRPTEMQVTSIEETVPGHKFKATAQSYQFSGRYGFITENSRGDYAASSDDEKEKGTYIVDEGTLVFGDGTGPYLMF